MKNIHKIAMSAAACVVGFLFAGCSTNLKVTDSSGAEVNGVPVRISQTYEVRGMLTGHSKVGKNCEPTPFYRTISLPTGGLYFINVQPGALADSAFDLQFTDIGSLKSVSMNSTPAAKEALEGAVGLATDVIFPIAGIGNDTGDSSPTAGPQNAPAIRMSTVRPSCDVGEASVNISVLK